jgi:hypothetical protein
LGIIADVLLSIHHDIQGYNQKKYNQWKRKKKREQGKKNSYNHDRNYPTRSYAQQNIQPRFHPNFARPIPRYPTLKGSEMVRSLSEKYVADFLYTNKVEYEYEKHIVLEGNEIKPDFYLPTYYLYVEFWGMLGDPNYSKKVDWKFDIYQRHRINFIALNPDDLPDLRNRFPLKLQYAIRNRR